MSRHPDMTGQRHGRLVVLRYLCRSRTVVRCRCDCGAQSDHDAADLRRGHTRSCGCLARELAAALRRQYSALRWANADRLSEEERERLAAWIRALGRKGVSAQTGLSVPSVRHARAGARANAAALAALRALIARPLPEPLCQHPGCTVPVVLGVRGRRCRYCPEHRVVRTGRPQTGRPRKRRPALAPAPPPRPAPLAPPCPHCRGPVRYQHGAPYCARNRCEEAAVLPVLPARRAA